MTTSLSLASLEHLDALRRLLQTARYSYKNIGDEDLRLLIESGVAVLANEGPALWGAFGISLEERPISLPEEAANRGSVNIAAFMPGYWPGDWIPILLDEAELAVPMSVRPLHISSYAPSTWMERGLVAGGFEIEAQIMSMALDKLQQRTFDPPHTLQTELRPARPEDLPAVAEMDATIFDPLWHFGDRHLHELLWRGRMQLALYQQKIVGYSALLSNSQAEAQLARLAVVPTMQGKGIGRQLLIDSIHTCRELGYQRLALNTQTSNLRSQALYASFGFRPYGERISVLSKHIY